MANSLYLSKMTDYFMDNNYLVEFLVENCSN